MKFIFDTCSCWKTFFVSIFKRDGWRWVDVKSWHNQIIEVTSGFWLRAVVGQTSLRRCNGSVVPLDGRWVVIHVRPVKLVCPVIKL